MRSRAEGAVKLVWQLMEWGDNSSAGIVPDVHVAWDEASCVQFVYLYGEITQKLAARSAGFCGWLDASAFLPRPTANLPPPPSPSHRSASPRSTLAAAPAT